jgi:hypothetical protein
MGQHLERRMDLHSETQTAPHLERQTATHLELTTVMYLGVTTDPRSGPQLAMRWVQRTGHVTEMHLE